MNLKNQCIYDELLFHGVPDSVRESHIVDFLRQRRDLRPLVVNAVLQPFFLAVGQPPHRQIVQPVNSHSLRFFRSRQTRTGFADVRRVTLPGKILVRFVLAADFTVRNCMKII